MTDGRGNVSDTALRTATRPNVDSPLFNKVRVTTARSLPETKPISDGTEDIPEGVTKISTQYARWLLDQYKVADSKEKEEEEEERMNPVTLEEVTKFIRSNPTPEDYELHNWAELRGVSPHSAEELLYELAHQAVTGKRPEVTVQGGPEDEEEEEEKEVYGLSGDKPNTAGMTRKQLRMLSAPTEIADKVIASAGSKEAELDPAFSTGFKETINANMKGPKLAPRKSDKSLAQKVAEYLLEKAAQDSEGGIPTPLLMAAAGGVGGAGYGKYRGAKDWSSHVTSSPNRERMWGKMQRKHLNPARFSPSEKALFEKYMRHTKGLQLGKKGLMGAGAGLLAGLLFS